MKKYHQIIRWLKNAIKRISPGKHAIEGASLGLLIVTAVLWTIFAIGFSIKTKDPWVLLFALFLALAATLLGFLIRWAINLFNSLQTFYKLALLIAIPLLISMSFGWMLPVIFTMLSSLAGAAVLVLKKTGFQNLSKIQRVITILGMVTGFGGFLAAGFFYSQDGFEMDPTINAALSTVSNIEPIQAISPAEKGPYTVQTLSYGSGKDLHRSEYGAEVDFKTDSVNGLAFIDNWKGFGGWWRTTYWGFDSKSLPINARVWYPQGEGPFPLALIVHGNHSMQDYSDPGYEYLGELLASRGIILASVDENFINSSWSDIFGGLKKENDARAWLLLEHLKAWHSWNRTEGHPFYQKVDTASLALIGHSRGGEAVAHAAMFNKLPFYPDDASVTFRYNYNIKSIVAIAPVDGQYKPGNSRTKIEDINYFVMHGAQDGDVTSFNGSQQYERVNFTDSLYHFKSGLYIYGANHGQFNTSWGNNDTGNPFLGLINLKQMLAMEDQLQIAKVYISAFLDISLKNKREFLPLFVDARKGKDWLPETIYLNQFEDSNFEPIANFDDDFDVLSTNQSGGEVSTQNLSVWREAEIRLKSANKGTRGLFIGWNYDLKSKKDSVETVADSLLASYAIKLPPTPLDSSTALVFSMAESKESANPKSKGKWVNNEDNQQEQNEDTKEKEEKEEEEKEDQEDKDKPKKPLDFTIQLSDTSGQKVSFPLSKFSPLQREIEVIIRKTGFIKNDKQSEKVFQTFYFPVKDFQKANPAFDLSSIAEIRFIFNKTQSGVVAIDNIGFMKSL